MMRGMSTMIGVMIAGGDRSQILDGELRQGVTSTTAAP